MDDDSVQAKSRLNQLSQMSLFKVTLNGNKHRFECSIKESILHAGLASGLNLKYGCDGGNCGDCLAQLQSGTIQEIKRSDFVVPRHLLNSNSFLMCCHAPSSDIEIQAVEHGSEAEIPLQTLSAKCYKLTNLSDRVKEIAFKTPRTQPLNFFAGQYLTLLLENGLSRNKSLASCPCDGLKPTIHVQYQEDDEFSDYLFNRLKKNESVTLIGPRGHFTLNEDSKASIVLIAYETGMASIKGLLEQLIALDTEQSITLYHLHTPECDHYLQRYCRSLDDAMDNFQYSMVCLKNSTLDCLHNVFGQIIEFETGIEQNDVYAALPRAFHSQAAEILSHKGLQQRQFKFDYLERL